MRDQERLALGEPQAKTALVTLYEAVGGVWESRDPANTVKPENATTFGLRLRCPILAAG